MSPVSAQVEPGTAHSPRMDDPRVGALLRALRRRRGWRQKDLAARTDVSPSTISRAERGHLDPLQVGTLRRVAAGLEVRLDLVPRWRGGDLDRIVATRHAALAETVLAELQTTDWTVAPEVSYNIWGERGVIDILAWRADRRAALVVELKSEIADPQALVAQVDRYRRLAPAVAAQRGWQPAVVGAWAVVEDSATNRRRLAANHELLRAALPEDGRRLRAWLREPAEPVAGLAFRSIRQAGTVHSTPGGQRRVRAPRAAPEPDGRPAAPGVASVDRGPRLPPGAPARPAVTPDPPDSAANGPGVEI